jgi:hypothetical protein
MSEDSNVKPFSKTQVKRAFNASMARVHQETDRDRRAAVRLQHVIGQLGSALSVLEGVVRRHGPQIFDRAALEELRGNVTLDITAERITLRLKEEVQSEA